MWKYANVPLSRSITQVVTRAFAHLHILKFSNYCDAIRNINTGA